MDTAAGTNCVNEFNPQLYSAKCTVSEHLSNKDTWHVRYSHNLQLASLSLHKSCCYSLQDFNFKRPMGRDWGGRAANMFHFGPMYNAVIAVSFL